MSPLSNDEEIFPINWPSETNSSFKIIARKHIRVRHLWFCLYSIPLTILFPYQSIINRYSRPLKFFLVHESFFSHINIFFSSTEFFLDHKNFSRISKYFSRLLISFSRILIIFSGCLKNATRLVIFRTHTVIFLTLHVNFFSLYLCPIRLAIIN